MNYAWIENGFVTNVFVWDGDTEAWSPPAEVVAVLIEDGQEVAIGYSYDGVKFTPPPEPPKTPAEILASQSSKLQGLVQLATAQKNALTNRISTLQDAIDNVGVEGMEEFAATPEEQDEFTKRKAQLVKWKNYSILLGRVTSQAGWPPEVDWPVQPSEGMDLTVSASASAQAV